MTLAMLAVILVELVFRDHLADEVSDENDWFGTDGGS